MNAQANEAAPAAAAKKGREVEIVRMEDGREVAFPGTKTKILKEGIVRLADGKVVPIDEATPEQVNSGELAVRIDFRNGATRTYPINSSIWHRYAVHGALQKYGDQLAGGVKKPDGTESEDLDDWALETDALHEQLLKGEWARTRVGGGGGGTSVLVAALMEFTGRTREEVMAHIKDWTPAQKQQLRLDPEIKPIVDRIEAEKAKKASHVDTGALKDSLKGLASAAA